MMSYKSYFFLYFVYPPGKPMPKLCLGEIPHLLRCQGLAVDYGFPGKDTVFLGKLSFALGRLGSEVSSTFAPLVNRFNLFLPVFSAPSSKEIRKPLCESITTRGNFR